MSEGSSDAGARVIGLLERLVPESTRSELEQALARKPLSVIAVLALLAGAGRRTLGARASLDASQLGALRELGYAAAPELEGAAILRALTLLRGCQLLGPAAQLELATRAYRSGSNEERVALLKSLPLLPGAERFVGLAQDACRSHVLDVFEAIACENPYPLRHFDAASYNQLVVKALFMGTQLSRIAGLAERNGDELRRMVRAYASERRAAGRSVPRDVTLVEPSLETEP